MNNIWQRRSAIVNVNKGTATRLHLEVGPQECHVLGLFQVQEEDDVQPYFVCELHNGQCIYVDPINVRFTDTDEEGKLNG